MVIHGVVRVPKRPLGRHRLWRGEPQHRRIQSLLPYSTPLKVNRAFLLMLPPLIIERRRIAHTVSHRGSCSCYDLLLVREERKAAPWRERPSPWLLVDSY